MRFMTNSSQNGFVMINKNEKRKAMAVGIAPAAISVLSRLSHSSYNENPLP